MIAPFDFSSFADQAGLLVSADWWESLRALIGKFITTRDFGDKMLDASWQTFVMVSVSLVLTTILGVPLGVLLVTTREGHILGRHRRFNRVLGLIVNAIRSIPFIIFALFISPLTRALVGSEVGTAASIVPLAVGTIAFMGRLAENALLEVPYGVIEAAQSAGASNWQIIRHVLLPEGRPGLIQAVTVMIIALIGYSAMVGAIGGGGLGDLAVRHGYQRYALDIMISTVIILIIVVQAIQSTGDAIARKVDHR